MSARLVVRGLVLVFAMISLAGSARAEPAEPSLDARETEAREMFGVGKFAEALEIYGKLYAETTHPTYLRNIGRCYQNLGDADKAISAFREYLRQGKDVAPDQRALVEGYIREMEALKQKKESAAVPPPAPVAQPNAPTPPEPQASKESATSGPTVEPRGSRIPRWVGLSLVGVGVVGAAVGTVYGLRVWSQNDSAKGLCNPNGVCASMDELTKAMGYRNEARHSEAISITSFSIGGAALVAGSLLAVLSGRGSDAGDDAVRVSVSADGLNVALARRW
jgi:tetratricopeptide (TPR) repeat protein